MASQSHMLVTAARCLVAAALATEPLSEELRSTIATTLDGLQLLLHSDAGPAPFSKALMVASFKGEESRPGEGGSAPSSGEAGATFPLSGKA